MAQIFKRAILTILTLVILNFIALPSYGSSQKINQDTETNQINKSDSTSLSENNIMKTSEKEQTKKTGEFKQASTEAYMNILLYLIYKMSGKM